jgi:hypothetical protein
MNGISSFFDVTNSKLLGRNSIEKETIFFALFTLRAEPYGTTKDTDFCSTAASAILLVSV